MAIHVRIEIATFDLFSSAGRELRAAPGDHKIGDHKMMTNILIVAATY